MEGNAVKVNSEFDNDIDHSLTHVVVVGLCFLLYGKLLLTHLLAYIRES
jgi:hypothetical protein